MMRTAEDIAQQLVRLKEKNPLLREVEVRSLADSGRSLEEVSLFIEENWGAYYGDEARITFTPEFLRFTMLSEVSPVLLLDGNIVGTFLLLDAPFDSPSGLVKGSYATGLTTAPELRGQRLSQLAVLNIENSLVQKGYDFCVFWLDNRHAQQGSSYQTYRSRSKRTEWEDSRTIFAKSLDYEMTAAIAKLSPVERIAIRATQALFPSRSATPAGMDIRDFDPSMADACLSFVNDSHTEMRRIYTPEELARKFTFNEGRVTAVSSVLTQGSDVQGIIYGFTNPVRNGISYFQVDGAIFDPSLSWNQKRKFFSAFEARIIDQGCASCAVPGSATREKMMRFGYIPLMTQHIGANFYTTTVREADLDGVLFELR